jgi:hypothetical protein
MENQTLDGEGTLEGADIEDDSISTTDDADTLEQDGESNSDDFLSKAKEITGREFKDEEDFKKHYKNLSSFVGKKVAQKEAQKETPKETKVDSKEAPSDRVSELEFKVDHPELKEHFDVIKMVSKEKGISYNDAVSDATVKEIVELRQSKKGESVIHSNNKISSSSPDIAKLKQNVNTTEGLAAYLKAQAEE